MTNGYNINKFLNRTQICAIGYTKGAFWKNNKAQDMKMILKNCGVIATVMKISPETQHVFETDYQLLKSSITKNN